MKAIHHFRAKAGGFSLIELAVVLAVIGAIGLVLWQVTPRIKSLPAFARLNASSLDHAEEALDGYLLANSRLPCPDTTGDGQADCSSEAVVGWLPVHTLGLNLPERVRYGVYRAPDIVNVTLDADLATLVNRFAPLLPPTVSSPRPLNGLDFCVALSNAMRTPGTSLTAGSQRIPVAYGLAIAGAGDADGAAATDGTRSAFDGLNTTTDRFEVAGTRHSATYDDDTRTVGSAELFTRLGCATQLAAANGAARAAYSAYDTDRFALLHRRFRDFQVTVRESNVKTTEASVVLAALDLANAIGTSANAFALVYETFGSYTPVALSATLSIGAAVANVTATSLALVSANTALSVARQQATAAANFKAATFDDLTKAGGRALDLDAKGILP